MQKQLNEELFPNIQCFQLLCRSKSDLKYFDVKTSLSPNFKNINVFQSLLTSRLNQLISRFLGQAVSHFLLNFSVSFFYFIFSFFCSEEVDTFSVQMT